MTLKPEDRGKAVALVFALVAVFGFIIYRIVSSGGSSSESKSGAAASAAPTPPPIMVGGEQTKQAIEGSVPLEEIDSRTQPPIGPPGDPFRRIVVVSPGDQGTNAPPPGQPPTGSTVGPGLGPAGPSLPPAEPIVPPFVVQGVIVGTPSYAVLRQGEQVIYIRSGDVYEKVLKVVRITETGVYVRHKGKTSFIRVGEGFNVAPTLPVLPPFSPSPAG